MYMGKNIKQMANIQRFLFILNFAFNVIIIWTSQGVPEMGVRTRIVRQKRRKNSNPLVGVC